MTCTSRCEVRGPTVSCSNSDSPSHPGRMWADVIQEGTSCHSSLGSDEDFDRAPLANQKQLPDSYRDWGANRSHGWFWSRCGRNEAELTHHSQLMLLAKHYHLLIIIIFLAPTGNNCYELGGETIAGMRTKRVGEVGRFSPADTHESLHSYLFFFFFHLVAMKVLSLALADTPMNSAPSFPFPVIALNLLRLASSRGDCSCPRLAAALTKGTGWPGTASMEKEE